jgi:hypothetical protein
MATNTAVRLLQLPPHLIAQVMGGFDELGSLYSTILGHRAFYHTFTVHRNFILASIIRNQIPANVLPIALALCEVTHVDLVDNDAVHRLLDSMNDRLSRPSNIDIPIIPTSDFVTISKTHATVQRLLKCFADEAIPLSKVHSTSTGILCPRRPKSIESNVLCTVSSSQIVCTSLIRHARVDTIEVHIMWGKH